MKLDGTRRIRPVGRYYTYYFNRAKGINKTVYTCHQTPEAALDFAIAEAQTMEAYDVKVSVGVEVWGLDGDPDCWYNLDLEKGKDGIIRAVADQGDDVKWVFDLDEFDIDFWLGEEVSPWDEGARDD